MSPLGHDRVTSRRLTICCSWDPRRRSGVMIARGPWALPTPLGRFFAFDFFFDHKNEVHGTNPIRSGKSVIKSHISTCVRPIFCLDVPKRGPTAHFGRGKVPLALCAVNFATMVQNKGQRNVNLRSQGSIPAREGLVNLIFDSAGSSPAFGQPMCDRQTVSHERVSKWNKLDIYFERPTTNHKAQITRKNRTLKH